ncbi:hypothetical protein [Merismopedia glauca]|uniref:Uncharacterized protein n=1 Tax=Merismopedia glauca CCAP 1448/3 TaxID=1296344 RepID=A0A2T1CA66_9CYAN|nr:hypothetical protein [Merismopedia glauca]PSB05162.1 hypothetical protein C7B64_00505 [Merismopedia glauca CCAP 1448/3]
MTKNNFFQPQEFTEDKLRVEIPPETSLIQGDRVPNGYDPMGQVYLEGRAYRGFGGGSTPWWVIISGWMIFGSFSFLTLGVALEAIKDLLVQKSTSGDLLASFFGYFPLIIAIIISGSILFILWKGTKAKLARKRRNR